MSPRRPSILNKGTVLIVLGTINVAVFGVAHLGDSAPPPVNVNDDRMQLVGEVSIELLIDPRNAESAAVQKLARTPIGVCREWGPLLDQREIDSVLSRLREIQVEPRVILTEVQVERRYAVNIGPFHDRAKLKAIEARLDDGGIDRLRFGSDPNLFISAGVFSSRERALRQRDRLLNLGLDSALEISGRPAKATIIRAFMPRSDDSGAPCPDIAQGG